jgi:hypothetical protein
MASQPEHERETDADPGAGPTEFSGPAVGRRALITGLAVATTVAGGAVAGAKVFLPADAPTGTPLDRSRPTAPQPTSPQPARTVPPAVPQPQVDPEQPVPSPLPAEQPIVKGPARANDAAGELSGPIARGTHRGPVGAVEAFVSDATWAIASPAAEHDPAFVSQSLGGHLNFADASMLDGFGRDGGVGFVPSSGAYRTLGHSGPRADPDQVMVEVAARMVLHDSSRWVVIGGVIAWLEDAWYLTGIRPREVDQPSEPAADLPSLSAGDQRKVLDGLGWRFFANGPAQ